MELGLWNGIELGTVVGLLLDGRTVLAALERINAGAIVDASDGNIDGLSVGDMLGIMVGI
jgi:hypothetical protein